MQPTRASSSAGATTSTHPKSHPMPSNKTQPPNTPETCDNCKFYVPELPLSAKQGICKWTGPQFFPPAGNNGTTVRGVWPLVPSSDWCGEYIGPKNQVELQQLLDGEKTFDDFERAKFARRLPLP